MYICINTLRKLTAKEAASVAQHTEIYRRQRTRSQDLIYKRGAKGRFLHAHCTSIPERDKSHMLLCTTYTMVYDDVNVKNENAATP